MTLHGDDIKGDEVYCMNNKKTSFLLADIFYIAMIIVPIIIGIVIKVLTEPPSEGITITGARVFTVVPMPVQDMPITESQINSWLVLVSLFGVCLYLTHGLQTKTTLTRQRIAEWVVEKTDNLVRDNMGEDFMGFVPFVGAIMALSALSSLLSLFGMFAPTSDLNVVAGWAILVFVLITYYKMKCGLVQYAKSMCDPIAILAPINVISEVATPISMSFRHYGNILSGTVISTLVAAGLQGLSAIIFGAIPIIGKMSLLRIGIPAIMSIYFDLFSGCLQAYIFAMLTMVYVTNGFDAEEYARRKERKQKKSQTVNVS